MLQRSNITKLGILFIAITLVLLLCNCFDSAIENAGASIDRGLEALSGSMDGLTIALEDIVSKLTEAGKSALANEVRQLVSATIAQSGAEFMCGADFLRERIKETLIGAKNELTNDSVKYKAIPQVCQWDQQFIDLSLPQSDRQHREFWGYNLEKKDKDGKGLEVFLVKDAIRLVESGMMGRVAGGNNNDSLQIISRVQGFPDRYLNGLRGVDRNEFVIPFLIPIAEESMVNITNCLSYPTEYSGIVNINNCCAPDDLAGADRMMLVWEGEYIKGIPILHPTPPRVRREQVNVGDREFTFTPPKGPSGDPDFNGECHIIAKASLVIDDGKTRLYLNIDMNAIEECKDWTSVDGITELIDQYLLYEAPQGFRIHEISWPTPPEDEFEYIDDDYSEDIFNIESLYGELLTKILIIKFIMGDKVDEGEIRRRAMKQMDEKFTYNCLVKEWKFIGDTKGAEAGSETRVKVQLYDVGVEIIEDI